MPHGERLESAVTAMLDELRAEQEREGALGCELIESRHRRRELLRSMAILIKTFPEADRRRHAKRLERVEALHRAPRRRPGASERSEAVLAFLAGYPGDEVRAAELGQALVETGLDPGRAYGAQALHRLGRQGLVVRVGQGRYRISRQHPELVALRRKGLEQRGREG